MKNKTTLAAFITAILLSSSAAYAAGIVPSHWGMLREM